MDAFCPVIAMISCELRAIEGGPSMPKPNVAAKRPALPIDPYVTNLLEKTTEGKRILTSKKGDKIFSQGDPADAIFFIQSGKVKMTVVSAAGKEAIIAILGPHSFLGEGALVGQSLRVSSATVIQPSVIFRVEKSAM